MAKPQPTFPAEFKHEAVQLAQNSDKPKAQIARELGISDSALSAWCKQAGAHGKEAFPGKGHHQQITSQVLLVKADVSKKTDVEHLIQQCLQHFGAVDVLVNNAACVIDKMEDNTCGNVPPRSSLVMRAGGCRRTLPPASKGSQRSKDT